jgi:predicted RNA binding protein YcfA (HicA-like mRNA interferase family)
MTDKLPRLNAADAIRALEKAGFFLARQSGSHKIYKNAEGKRLLCHFILEKSFIPKS